MASRSRQHLSGNLGVAGSGPENLFARRDGSQKGGTRRHAPLLRGMKWRKSGCTRLSPLEEARFELSVPPRWRTQLARRFTRYRRGMTTVAPSPADPEIRWHGPFGRVSLR